MAEFDPFAKLIEAQFARMSQGELFEVDIAGDAVYAHYLASFPEGTDPVFRKRSEHDCSCCRHFIRNLGNVVSIKDGKIVTIWDIKGAESPYAEVAAALSTLVGSKPIKGLFRTEFATFGVAKSTELKNGVTRRWTHMYAPVGKNQHVAKKFVGPVVGGYNTAISVFKRGLDELKASAFETVLDLIAAKNLYRGQEFLASILEFQKVQKRYQALKDEDKANFVWANGDTPVARFRNTMIGTLLQDLSGAPARIENDEVIPAKEPLDLELAVKLFETKAAPENYKRTTALITPKMIKDALQTLKDENLEDAVQRRFAKISDVSVNNVLWVAGDVKSKMKGGLEDLLMSVATKQAPKLDNKLVTEDISMEAFMATIVPRAKTMELVVKNGQMNKFMSLTAPQHADSGSLFKWKNDFAWSYDGEVTDSLRQQVQARGGRVDGVLRFSHSWNYEARNTSLMDLHVFMPGSSAHKDGTHDSYPSGQRVGWNERKDRSSGGVQDVDYTAQAPEGYVPVENITFPDMKRLREGKYVFKIHNWDLRQPTKGGFKAEIELNGQVFEYEHVAPLKNKEWVTVAEATLKNGVFTIDHKLKPGMASRDKWGISTETFVKVETLMMSPNYWDDNAVGNKHWFFILEGCKNPNPTRGIYNEYLSPKFDKHRKVFEVLAGQTKCQPADEQLSGVGFSSTAGDIITVRVTGDKLYKTYNITF